MENSNVKANYVAHLKNGEILKMGFRCESIEYDEDYVIFYEFIRGPRLAIIPKENVLYIERKEKKVE